MPVIDLQSIRCRFTCTGPDAPRFLNGQVTQDIRRVTPGHALPACLTNAKGRLEAELVIAALPDGYLIDAPACLRGFLGQRLEKYLIADDCHVTDVTGSTVHFHFLGEDPAHLPPGCNQVTRLGQAGWDHIVPEEEAGTTRASLPPGIAGLSSDALDDERIRRGIPVWGAELDGDTLPPEAGLDSTHVSYTKGCYIGQEVISRLRSVGQVARKLCLLVPSGEGRLTTSMPLHSTPAPEAGTRPLGTITSATSDGRTALGYLRRPHHLGESLVYALPNDGSSLSIPLGILPCPLPPTTA